MSDGFRAKDYSFFPSCVLFQTEDADLQKLYDKCEKYAEKNKAFYVDKTILREGAEYNGVWMETQPMGGAMYAKRDVETGLNNQLIFMEYQRRDGRFPGTIRYSDSMLLQAHYGWMQGYCFPVPALSFSYLIGHDRKYLELLYTSLRDFDRYLWKYRDSDGDGCLETWCVWDTGEDHCTRFERFGARDGGWGGEDPPSEQGRLPYESMLVMSYSCQGREVLAEVSRLLKNGEEELWKSGAEAVRRKIREYLWDEEKGACYDRDCDNKQMDTLYQGNLQCMYYGAFSQDMADRFVAEHLLNPDEFWTLLPLPSIAANDPLFENDPKNNWSGQVEGLTYQRAIQALELYGYEAEVRILGKKWISNLIRTGCLVQQYDPFTGEPGLMQAEIDGEREIAYGPTILAALEYISRLYGIDVFKERVRWSAVSGGMPSSYTQKILGKTYCLRQDGKNMTAFVDGSEVFSCSTGAMVETNLDGVPQHLYGIEETGVDLILRHRGKILFEGLLRRNEHCVLRISSVPESGGVYGAAAYS